MLFLNRSFDKKRLKALLLWFRLNLSEGAALKAVELLQGLGFRSATQGAISLGLDDLKTPASKGGRVFQAQLEVALAHHEHHRGNRTPVELFQHLVDTWHRTSQDLTTEVVQLFHSTERVNPVYMMAFSGARGNISQVRQLVGMRGLMADPRGQIVGFPILSNFREGLTITEYFVSCYGARKGVVDTAIRTADAGYLTRRLADVSHHVVVRTTNCGTHRSIQLRNIKEGDKIILSLANRLIGRVLAENIVMAQSLPSMPHTQLPSLANNKVVYRNSEITPLLASKLASQYTEVSIRSPLSCSLPWGVCQLCYGWGLSEGRRVTLGEAVGIIAAQSIGEPGTQLTLRTFHTGGVFSGELLNEIRAPYGGIILFPKPLQGLLLRTPHGQIAFLTKAPGEMKISSATHDDFLGLKNNAGGTLNLDSTAMHTQKTLPLASEAATNGPASPLQEVKSEGQQTSMGEAGIEKFTESSPSPDSTVQFLPKDGLYDEAKETLEDFVPDIRENKRLNQEKTDLDLVQTNKREQEFVIQPSTVIFVKQKEQVYPNQLLAEFSSSTLQSANDQIEITQQVLSETAGQVWFKELDYGNRKGSGSGFLGTNFSSQNLGGIWVLAGKPRTNKLTFNEKRFFTVCKTKGQIVEDVRFANDELLTLPLVQRGYAKLKSTGTTEGTLTNGKAALPILKNCNQVEAKGPYKTSVINLRNDSTFFTYSYFLGYSLIVRSIKIKTQATLANIHYLPFDQYAALAPQIFKDGLGGTDSKAGFASHTHRVKYQSMPYHLLTQRLAKLRSEVQVPKSMPSEFSKKGNVVRPAFFNRTIHTKNMDDKTWYIDPYGCFTPIVHDSKSLNYPKSPFSYLFLNDRSKKSLTKTIQTAYAQNPGGSLELNRVDRGLSVPSSTIHTFDMADMASRVRRWYVRFAVETQKRAHLMLGLQSFFHTQNATKASMPRSFAKLNFSPSVVCQADPTAYHLCLATHLWWYTGSEAEVGKKMGCQQCFASKPLASFASPRISGYAQMKKQISQAWSKDRKRWYNKWSTKEVLNAKSKKGNFATHVAITKLIGALDVNYHKFPIASNGISSTLQENTIFAHFTKVRCQNSFLIYSPTNPITYKIANNVDNSYTLSCRSNYQKWYTTSDTKVCPSFPGSPPPDLSQTTNQTLTVRPSLLLPKMVKNGKPLVKEYLQNQNKSLSTCNHLKYLKWCSKSFISKSGGFVERQLSSLLAKPPKTQVAEPLLQVQEVDPINFLQTSFCATELVKKEVVKKKIKCRSAGKIVESPFYPLPAVLAKSVGLESSSIQNPSFDNLRRYAICGTLALLGKQSTAGIPIFLPKEQQRSGTTSGTLQAKKSFQEWKGANVVDNLLTTCCNLSLERNLLCLALYYEIFFTVNKKCTKDCSASLFATIRSKVSSDLVTKSIHSLDKISVSLNFRSSNCEAKHFSTKHCGLPLLTVQYFAFQKPLFFAGIVSMMKHTCLSNVAPSYSRLLSTLFQTSSPSAIKNGTPKAGVVKTTPFASNLNLGKATNIKNQTISAGIRRCTLISQRTDFPPLLAANTLKQQTIHPRFAAYRKKMQLLDLLSKTIYGVSASKNNISKQVLLKIGFNIENEFAIKKNICKRKQNTDLLPSICRLPSSHDVFTLLTKEKTKLAKQKTKSLLTIHSFWEALSFIPHPSQYTCTISHGHKLNNPFATVNKKRNVSLAPPVWPSLSISSQTLPPAFSTTTASPGMGAASQSQAKDMACKAEPKLSLTMWQTSTNLREQRRTFLQKGVVAGSNKKYVDRNEGNLDQHIVHTVNLPVLPFLYIICQHSLLSNLLSAEHTRRVSYSSSYQANFSTGTRQEKKGFQSYAMLTSSLQTSQRVYRRCSATPLFTKHLPTVSLFASFASPYPRILCLATHLWWDRHTSCAYSKSKQPTFLPSFFTTDWYRYWIGGQKLTKDKDRQGNRWSDVLLSKVIKSEGQQALGNSIKTQGLLGYSSTFLKSTNIKSSRSHVANRISSKQRIDELKASTVLFSEIQQAHRKTTSLTLQLPFHCKPVQGNLLPLIRQHLWKESICNVSNTMLLMPQFRSGKEAFQTR